MTDGSSQENPFSRAPGPPGDWTRLVGEALGDGQAFESLRDHLADGETQCVDWCPVCRLADVIRANTTPELREQLSSLQREALLTVRAVVDHYLERSETERPAGPRVDDIPIE
jgi:hypothetical protein